MMMMTVKWTDWRKGPKANVAGLTNWITEKNNNGEVEWTIQEIVLNSRLVNTKARLVEILYHELCHQGETEFFSLFSAVLGPFRLQLQTFDFQTAYSMGLLGTFGHGRLHVLQFLRKL
jgi:hypothetical protein